MQQARLIFEDGLTFLGTAFTQTPGTVFAELVFNTAMTGYEEVITDPSYKGQMVVMTYPLAGNYGFNTLHTESSSACIEALLVKTYLDMPSLTGQTLKGYLDQQQVLGVENIDTRAVVRYLRSFGAKRAVLTTQNLPVSLLVEQLKQWNMPATANLIKTPHIAQTPYAATTQPAHYRVAVVNTGAKNNIMGMLQQLECSYTLVAPDISAGQLLSGNFDGVLLANGPGNPHQLPQLIQTIQQLLGKLPVFGICMGHQLLGLALGLEVVKLKFGHHGVNHPVKNLLTGKVEITSHNHNYAVTLQSVQQCAHVQLTHLNLLDNTVAGIKHRTLPAFSVQYHPEAAPGPTDSHYLFHEFVTLMETWKCNQK